MSSGIIFGALIGRASVGGCPSEVDVLVKEKAHDAGRKHTSTSLQQWKGLISCSCPEGHSLKVTLNMGVVNIVYIQRQVLRAGC